MQKQCGRPLAATPWPAAFVAAQVTQRQQFKAEARRQLGGCLTPLATGGGDKDKGPSCVDSIGGFLSLQSFRKRKEIPFPEISWLILKV